MVDETVEWIDWKRVVIAFKLTLSSKEKNHSREYSVQRYGLLETLPGNRR